MRMLLLATHLHAQCRIASVGAQTLWLSCMQGERRQQLQRICTHYGATVENFGLTSHGRITHVIADQVDSDIGLWAVLSPPFVVVSPKWARAVEVLCGRPDEAAFAPCT